MMKEFIAQHWSEGFFSFVGSILAWLGLREVRRNDEARTELKKALEAHHERIQKLEENHVSSETLDELRASMTASFVNLADRIDKKMDSMHNENRETLKENRRALRDIHGRVDDIYKLQVRADQ